MARKALASSDAAAQIGTAILDFIADIPKSKERRSSAPAEAARKRTGKSAAAAAFAAGSLALPPGPAGWLTILPEMLAVWKIQAQLVSDIASLYGRKDTLTQEQMIYCLFKHTAAQAVRDLVVRVGERVLVRRASLRLLQSIAARIGVKVTQRLIGKGISRWLPVLGAVGVGAYAYYDTAQVAATAVELFEAEIEIEPLAIEA